MSERLTKRTENGDVQFSNGEYWNTVYPQNEHCLTDIHRMAIKLCELEDKICEGRMVELPCAVGQTIYVLTADSPTGIEETKISQVVVRLKGNSKPQYSILAPCVYDDWGKAKWSFCDNNFGTDFFFDRASAEAKLRKMEGEKR